MKQKLTAITWYYASTVVFVAMDFWLHFNVRSAFFAESPGLRAIYYLICFAILVAIVLKPHAARLLCLIDSIFVLSALIISTASRILIVTDDMLETGRGLVTMPEMLNFMLSGTFAYITYRSSLAAVAEKHRLI